MGGFRPCYTHITETVSFKFFRKKSVGISARQVCCDLKGLLDSDIRISRNLNHWNKVAHLGSRHHTRLFGEEIWSDLESSPTHKDKHTQIWAPAIAIVDGGKALECSLPKRSELSQDSAFHELFQGFKSWVCIGSLGGMRLTNAKQCEKNWR